MLTQRQFSALYHLYKHPSKIQHASALQDAQELLQMGFIDHKGTITPAGTDALEPYRVENAIILAAGMSSRFLPLSLETPKGLMLVKGEPMIERQIRQLREVGISDITVVVGYLYEKFSYLEDKYKVKLVINSDYNRYNNTSSLMLVLDQLKNTYICASDHYFAKNIFQSHCYHSTYPATMIHGRTSDYSYRTDSQGRITWMKTFSQNEMGLVGAAYLDRQTSQRFTNILQTDFSKPGVSDMVWEEVWVHHVDELEFYVEEYPDGIIYEFDNLEELRQFDDSYINGIHSKILDQICEILDCSVSDIQQVEPMKIGLTNTSFLFKCRGKRYVYRHPGDGTGQFLHRECEAYAEQMAKKLGLDQTVIYIDPVDGWKISTYIENCDYIDPYQDAAAAMQMLKKLHDQHIVTAWDFAIIPDAERYIDMMQGIYDFSPYWETHKKMARLYELLECEGHPRVLCHNDTWFWNFLKDPTGKIQLIDWEYAGNNYAAADVADYTISLDYSYEGYLQLAEAYEGHPLSKKEVRYYVTCLALIAWYWFVWGLWKQATGTQVDDLKKWYDKAIQSLTKAMDLYKGAE